MESQVCLLAVPSPLRQEGGPQVTASAAGGYGKSLVLFLLHRVRPKASGAVDERRDVGAEGVAAVPFAVTSRCF